VEVPKPEFKAKGIIHRVTQSWVEPMIRDYQRGRLSFRSRAKILRNGAVPRYPKMDRDTLAAESLDAIERRFERSRNLLCWTAKTAPWRMIETGSWKAKCSKGTST